MDKTKARPPRVRNGLDEKILLLLSANAPGGKRVMAEPFCIPEIEVTRYSLPDTRVAVNVPLPEKEVPPPILLNVKPKVAESANTFWVPASNKKRTATAAKILDDRRI